MAKNVKIIPSSGSLEFNDGSSDIISYKISGSTISVNSNDKPILEFEDGETIKQVNIDNDSELILPIQAGAPDIFPTGNLLFDSNTNSIVV